MVHFVHELSGKSMSDLKGQVAIVTGSAKGIGAAIAVNLAAAGVKVVIDYAHDAGPANSIRDEITAAKGEALVVAADVAKPADVEKLFKTAIDHFGSLDILVNNAGMEHRYPFVDTPDEVWMQTIAVNLTGPFLCSRAAAKQMIAQGKGGRIINISSIHEDVTSPTNGPYCATKGGLRMLMRTIAVELAQYGITVNNIAPGAIDTPMDAETKADKALNDELMAEIPLRRWGQPHEIASLCRYLCSEEASYITGTTMVIDGGMMRQAGSL